MKYEPKNYDVLLGLEGFSDALLKNHFALYSGYVANTNKCADLLDALAKEGKQAIPEYAEVKRRLGWEFNGMRLHELYFENLAKGAVALGSSCALAKKISEDFISFEAWAKDFKATGAMRGIGWVVLYFDATGRRLFNAWINEHDVGHFSGCIPLVVMDVFEHSYMTDYGLKRADYIENFFKAIDWKAVERRFGQ